MSPPPPRTLGPAVRIFLRHFSPVVLVVLATAALIWRATLGPLGLWDAAIVVGWWAFWPVQEWLIHVFILHFRPRQLGKLRLDPLNAQKHRAHHRDPNNIELVFIPWFSVVSSLPLLVAGAWLLAPTAALAATAIASYLVFAVNYEWSHYLAHVPYTPNIAYYQRICKAHTLHHFRNEQYWFGVSRTFGDVLLNTAPEAKSTPLSETVRTLGIELEG
ncbi:MAG: sterol desaturase family protein [Deltaproteobacteria bacterium]|nr:sterol desaturase family protein [Deltaproteobacteria bacterium]